MFVLLTTGSRTSTRYLSPFLNKHNLLQRKQQTIAFKKLVFKSMIYRDLHLDDVKDKLEKSFEKLSPESKKIINEIS